MSVEVGSMTDGNGNSESRLHVIDWEETQRIVASNEEAIKRYERERPARQAKREQRRAELQAMIDQLRQLNTQLRQLSTESFRRSEEWRQRNHL